MLRSDLPLIALADLPGGAQTVVLCHSARLATDLRRAHGMQQAARGLASWHALQTATPALWLDHLCSGALLRGEIPPDSVPGVFLTVLQERSLWEQAIRTDARHAEWMAELFDINGMAQVAMEAGNLTQVWRLEVPEAQQTEECRAFLRWQASVLANCEKNGWCPRTQALAWRTDCVTRGVTGLPKQIGIAGFTVPDPAMSRLLVALEARGVSLFRLDFGCGNVVAVDCREQADAKAECVAAAQWAAEQLRSSKQYASSSSPVRVRIAVADLPARRSMIEHALANALHPNRIGAGWAAHETEYQILSSEVIADQALVDVGLRLLQLMVHPRRVALADFGALLCAPGWSSDVGEADGRACLEAQLRELLPPQTSLERLYRAVLRVQADLDIPILCGHLDQLLNAGRQLRTQPKRQLPSVWAAQFLDRLAAMAWPGERPLIAVEVAARSALRETLASMTTLDALLGRVEASEVLRHLQRQCRDQPFQAPRQALVRVEVCSLADAVAAPVDALWVMGLNEGAWPPVARPNPLLPADLQRRAGIATARADSLSEQARAMQTVWQSSANQVVFSWAARDGERELRPSPLLAALVGTPLLDPTDAKLLQCNVASPALSSAGELLERFIDARAPTLSDTEVIRGGTRLLQAQAICPAWAFYQFRLGGSVLPAPTGGLDALARGSLLHATLEAFWRGRSHADLIAMDEPLRREVLALAADHALAEYDRRAMDPLPPRLRQLEHSRLVALVLEWLKLEAQREPFRVIACEEHHDLELEGLRIRVVVDRVDQLADGRLVIMDYKAGRNVSANSWAKQRITEPQVPVYAALAFADQPLAAAVLARVTLDAPAFIGVAESEGVLPQVKSLDQMRARFPQHEFADWPDLRQCWMERLNVLANEIKDGCAAVVFESETAVAYCDVLPLLRVAERRAQFEE